MSAFDSAFDASFDAGGVGPAVPEYGQPTVALAISVVSPLVFSSAAGHIKWAITATVGGAVLSRYTGRISIEAAEDQARIATFSVIPASAAELNAYENAQVTLDVTLFRTGQMATLRRFTGIVETVEFDAAARVATLHCRDAWQEIPRACASAAEVEALFGGLAYPCPRVVTWNNDQPDPAGYFVALQSTMLGSCAIDSDGIWQAVPWQIGAPSASFGTDEIFDGSLKVYRSQRHELPSGISARLNLRYKRLHSAEKSLSWSAPPRVHYVVDGIPTLTKSTVQAALSGLSDWLIKGKPVITEPTPGSYPVIVGPATVYYIVSHEVAAVTCDALAVSLYRRWYQEVQVNYRIDIAMGGLSSRDDSIAVQLTSDFDAGSWERAPTVDSTIDIYQANAPAVSIPPTGYEGLPAPHPAANGAIDYIPDISSSDLADAARHTVALAVHHAAAGKRKQAIEFERPADPRWEIGSVLAVSAYGISATGQLVSFDESYDVDSGDAVSRLRLACPDGSGSATSLVASVTLPTNTVGHALLMPPLDTHIGAAYSTPAVPVEANLLGFLCNALPTSSNYDNSKPVYEPQFRIVMPGIDAVYRDPLEIDEVLTATVSIAGSGISMSF